MSETDETNDTCKKTTTDSRNEDANPSPDGGWGWVVCFAVYWLNFIVAGTSTSSGILLLGLVDHYNESIPKTAMVGSLYHGSLMSGGPLVLVLMTFQASHRQVIIFAGLVAFLSTFASVFAYKIEILYLTYGIVTGFSVGMAYFAGNTILASYFKKKRSLAVGIAFCGGGCGIFCLTYLIEKSISFYGIRGTFLLLSGLYLNFVVYGSLCRPLHYLEKTRNNVKVMKKNVVNVLQSETKPGFEPEDERTKDENKSSANKPGISMDIVTERFTYSHDKPDISMDNAIEGITYSQDKHLSTVTERVTLQCKTLFSNLFDPVVFKSHGFQLLLFIYFAWSVGEVIPIFLPANVVAVGLSRADGALIMSMYGAFSAVSQLVVGMIADFLHVPISYILTFSMMALTIASIAIPFCRTFIAFAICMAIYAIFYGFTIAIRVSLAASILGVRNLDKCYSPVCLLIGIGYLVFPLVSGELYDATQFLGAVFYFTGAILFLGLISSTGLIYMQVKGRFYE